MKKLFTLLAMMLMAIVANAMSLKLYAWESPKGIASEIGGTIAYENGDGNRLNYGNGGFYTICLNGKKANLADATASANAGHMVITFSNALKAGDKIVMTAYYNKGEDKKVSAWLVFENSTTASSALVTQDIAREGQPEEITVVVPAEADGSKTLTLTRNDSGTNMFITKLVVTGERPDEDSGKILGTLYDALAIAADKPMGSDVQSELVALINKILSCQPEDVAKCVDEVYAMIQKINASNAIYTQVESKIGELDDAIADSKAKQSVKDEAETLLDKLNNSYYEMTDAELTQAIKDVDAMIKKLSAKPNTIEAGKYTIKATVTKVAATIPAEFEKYVGEYTTNATLTGDETSLVISENAENGLFSGFEIIGDAVDFDAAKTITLGGKQFTVRAMDNADEAGSLAIAPAEGGEAGEFTMAPADVYYNGIKAVTVSNITIAPYVEPQPKVEIKNGTFDVAADWATSNIVLNPKTNVEAEAWTVNTSDSWNGIATIGLGTGVLLNNAALPATGADGKTEGGVLGVAASWGHNAAYQQKITLPAGKYELTYYAYEANSNATAGIAKNLIGFISDGGAEFLSTKTAYTPNQWTSESIIIDLAEETTGVISLGYKAMNITSNNTPKLFIDNVTIKAVTDLDIAKNKALALIPAADNSIFTPSEDDYNAFVAALEAAETTEDVDMAVEAVVGKIPAVAGEYTAMNVTANNYLGEAVLSDEPVAMKFIPSKNADGKLAFVINMGEKNLSMAGNNTWSMTMVDKEAITVTAWNFNLQEDGSYTIQGPNGLIGSDNADAGSATYGNKTAANNGKWNIELYDPTAADTVVAAPAAKKVVKFVENSKLVIVKDGKKFNVAGQEM